MDKSTNCVFVIFGASGDLTKRKLIPALFDLFNKNLLPDHFAVLGVGRTPLDDGDFRDAMNAAIQQYAEHKDTSFEHLDAFVTKLYYAAIDTAKAEDYTHIKQRLDEIDGVEGTAGNYLYYLSTPPKLYATIAHHLASQGLNHQSDTTGFRRLVIEKPFGYNLASAQALNHQLLEVFQESQLYRIDHYLGKETVQNLFVFRFANSIFEPLWNQKYIDYIEITSAESIGVEDRGGYYDGSGALRDMIQNHMMQLLALVTMEPPSSFSANAIRNETLKVFQSLRPISREEVPHYTVRGQYTMSAIDGERVSSYREEKGVNPDSRTETFAALKLFIDNWRWGGVPIYIRSGKRMPTRVTEMVVHFKPPPHHLFSLQSLQSFSHNELIIRIQPDEGILLKFGLKLPGASFQVQDVNMDFHYDDLADSYVPTAYERLLLDCMLGDATLYTRGDGVEACWQFVEPILQAWQYNTDIPVYGYPAGTWGPLESNALFDDIGTTWRFPCRNLAHDGIYCEL